MRSIWLVEELIDGAIFCSWTSPLIQSSSKCIGGDSSWSCCCVVEAKTLHRLDFIEDVLLGSFRSHLVDRGKDLFNDIFKLSHALVSQAYTDRESTYSVLEAFVRACTQSSG